MSPQVQYVGWADLETSELLDPGGQANKLSGHVLFPRKGHSVSRYRPNCQNVEGALDQFSSWLYISIPYARGYALGIGSSIGLKTRYDST